MLIVYTCGIIDNEDVGSYAFRITEDHGIVYEESKVYNDAKTSDDAELYAIYRSLLYIKNKFPRYFWWWENAVMFRLTSGFVARIFSFTIWLRMIFYKTSLLGKWKNNDWDDEDSDQVTVKTAEKCDTMIRSLASEGYTFMFDPLTHSRRLRTHDAVWNLEENIQRNLDAENRILDRTRNIEHSMSEDTLAALGAGKAVGSNNDNTTSNDTGGIGSFGTPGVTQPKAGNTGIQLGDVAKIKFAGNVGPRVGNVAKVKAAGKIK